MKTLRQSLLDRDLAFLEVIARQWGLVLEGRQKEEVLDQLESALLWPEAVATTLAELSPQERAALDALLAAGGQMPVESFIRHHGPIRRVGPGRLRREEPWRQPMGGAEGLWYRGLMALGFDLETPEAEVVYISSDLFPLLPRPQKGELQFVVASAPMPEQQKRGGSAFRQDTCTFLIYLYSVAVRPGPKGDIPQRHRRQLLGALLEEDSDRLALIEHLAQRLSLIEERDRRLQLNPSPTRAWLRASPAQQLWALQQCWRDSQDWNELWRVPGLQCQPTGWRNDPLTTRRRLLGWLARCPAGEWLSVESFVQALKSTDPDFQRPDGDYDGWYIRDVTTGGYLTGFESWERVEGALIRDLLARPLFWLGIVMLGMDEGRPVAFQITPQGEAFLAGGEPPAPEPTLPLAIAPDLTIRAPLQGSLYDRFQVARFAERVSVLAGKDTPPFGYRITPESLAGSREQGVALSQIVAFLERATEGNLPRNVPTLLADWERKADKITLRRAVLLQTADELTLQELQRLPQTRDYLRQVLGPRAALVAEGDWSRLVQALKELGYLPRVEGLGRDMTASPTLARHR